jgi:hypothetical protein
MIGDELRTALLRLRDEAELSAKLGPSRAA